MKSIVLLTLLITVLCGFVNLSYWSRQDITENELQSVGQNFNKEQGKTSQFSEMKVNSRKERKRTQVSARRKKAQKKSKQGRRSQEK